jgi:phosphoglycolate phosphatase-like HAD superfamily hydrolase
MKNIHLYSTIFFDFDGVIKDSVKVKSESFEKLFLPFGKKVANRIRTHHEGNNGMSRFDKLPIYIEWAGLNPSQGLIDEYADKFSSLAIQKVIDSKWVDGILSYLENNQKRQQFFLVTATPQKEINYILTTLGIRQYFKEVIGSPTKKSEGIKFLINKHCINRRKSVMVGDSIHDYEASSDNLIDFILRKTDLNKALQDKVDYLIIDNFI